jgi:mRNA-degrading endonuclease toxin of MazEF toxin-antitoxin module
LGEAVMDEPNQGDIWWADLPAPAGRRPVLILTRSDATFGVGLIWSARARAPVPRWVR